jgi:hypothetical protein
MLVLKLVLMSVSVTLVRAVDAESLLILTEWSKVCTKSCESCKHKVIVYFSLQLARTE